MSDFLRVQLESGNLTFIPVNAPDAGTEVYSSSASRVITAQIRGIPGNSTIQSLNNGQLSISARHVEGAQTIFDTISVSAASSRINHSVQSTPTENGPPAHLQQIMLTISTNTTLRVIQDSQIVATLSEKSFAELWTKHPDEVRKYLIPLFDSLDLQGVFSVKADEALHVFAPLLKGLPDVQAQIAALLPKLNDDSSTIRTDAIAELDAIGPNAVPIINALDLKTQPLQTRITLKDFLRHMADSHAVKDNRLEDPDYLMQCLAVDDPQIPALAKKQLEKVTGKPVSFNEKASLADRQTAVEKLRLQALAKPAP